jgi:Cupin-like domain
MTNAITTQTTLRRMPMPSRRDFYRDVAPLGQPVIFDNAMAEWPAMQRWDFDWFTKQHGEQPMPVEWLTYVPATDGPYATRKGRRQDVSVREAVEQTLHHEDSAGYLIGTEMYSRLPQLLDDLKFPHFQVSERLVKRLFFMGARGCYTQLHYDRAENMHAVFRGRKRWQLWSPRRTPELRPTDLEFVWSVTSGLDLGNARFREASELGLGAPDVDFVLEAGEILYLPYGWWHRVVTVEPAIATNLWWWTYGMLAKMGPSIAPSAARIAWRGRAKRNAAKSGGGDQPPAGM